ncbi:MAG: amino acid ABC transporter substrate-binding protein [Deltaproteobacteria bacterium]|nr:amino acid ABC transporter substrate-binding protein [Deltaproteobacteria bacterium]
MRKLGLILLAAVALVLAHGAALAQRPDAIKIGATLAVTGPFAPEWGPKFQEFMQTWEKVVNEEGGVLVREFNARLPIRLIIYDDESRPDKSVELYEKLAAVDRVHVFLGPSTSPITMRATTVAEKLRIPMVAAEANDTALFARGFRWFAGVLELGYWWSEHYFDMVKASNARGPTRYRTVAIVSSDTPHTKDVGTGAVEYARKAGLNVVASELVPFRTADFSAVIAKLRPLDPDIVFLSLWPAEVTAFVKQARELGLKPRDLHSRFIGKPLLTAVGAELAEGITGETYTARKYLDARARKIFERIKVDPYDLPWSGIKYTAMEALLAVIERAGTLDRTKIMETMHDPELRIKAIFGTLRWHWNFRRDGTVLNGFGTQKPIVAQFQGGRLQVIWPEAIADASYRPTPRPY